MKKAGLDRRKFLRIRHGLAMSAATSALMFFGATEAVAQQQAAAGADSGTQSVRTAGDSTNAAIIVTARRRAEDLERVPVAISAFGAAQLADHQITSQSDIQFAVPGLTIRTSETSNQFNYSLRGQSIDAYSASAPAVLSYVNDVQTTTAGQSSLYDLSSIQVVKGPQGTLFGRNATGGAVLFTTAKPESDFGGFVDVRLGNYAHHEISGALNIPLIKDVALLRIAGDLEQRDGYIYNLFNGDRLGAVSRGSARATLTLKPVAGLQNTTTFQYDKAGGTNTAVSLYSAYPCGSPPNNGTPLVSTPACLFSPALDSAIGVPGAWAAYLAANPKAPAGGLIAFLATQRANGPYRVDLNGSEAHHGEDEMVQNTTIYDFGPDTQVKNIFGFSHSLENDAIDLDGTPYQILYGATQTGAPGVNIYDTNQLSDELQFLGKTFDKRLTYLLGVYVSSEIDKNIYQSNAFNLEPILPPGLDDFAFRISDRTAAIFTQETYDLSEATGIHGLSVTGGVRYTWEKIGLSQLPGGGLYGAAPEKASFSKPSWQVGLEYQVSRQLLLYVEQRGSWRSGGFNAVAPPKLATLAEGGNEFLPETTHDVEVGAKYHDALFGAPVRFNLDGYSQWISNVQRADYVDINGGPVTLTANVPSAQVKGIEFDTEIDPARWFQFGGNFAYTDAKYTDGAVAYAGSTVVFGPYADTPKFSGSFFAQVILPISDSIGSLKIRGDLYAQTHEYFSNLENSSAPETSLPGYTLANFRIDWSNIGHRPLTASFFMKNAFNRVYYTGGFALGSALGVNGVTPGEPRMYGLELRYKF